MWTFMSVKIKEGKSAIELFCLPELHLEDCRDAENTHKLWRQGNAEGLEVSHGGVCSIGWKEPWKHYHVADIKSSYKKNYVFQKILSFNPIKAVLNFMCYLLALLGVHHILHVSRIRVNTRHWIFPLALTAFCLMMILL